MKRVISTCLTLCLSAALALPASALDYSIDAPGNPDYGDPIPAMVRPLTHLPPLILASS